MVLNNDDARTLKGLVSFLKFKGSLRVETNTLADEILSREEGSVTIYTACDGQFVTDDAERAVKQLFSEFNRNSGISIAEPHIATVVGF